MNPIRTFLIGILAGILLVGGGMFGLQYFTSKEAKEMPKAISKAGDDDSTKYWLLPKDCTVAQLIVNPNVLDVLNAPETVSIHRPGSGKLVVLDYHFTDEGVSPTPDDQKTLQSTFLAPNAYSMPSMCGFHPDALIRLQRGQDTVDVLVCFTCGEILWVLNEQKRPDMLPIGLSDIGIGSLKSVCRHAFPVDPAFKSKSTR